MNTVTIGIDYYDKLKAIEEVFEANLVYKNKNGYAIYSDDLDFKKQVEEMRFELSKEVQKLQRHYDKRIIQIEGGFVESLKWRSEEISELETKNKKLKKSKEKQDFIIILLGLLLFVTWLLILIVKSQGYEFI